MACNPTTIVNEVFSKHASSATEKGLTFRINPVANLPDTISSDAPRLEQLLSNLVENAIKFTRAGQVTLSAELTRHDDNATLTLTVEDTGIDIAENKLDSIFEPFVQVDGSMTREFGGTGLGLTISRQIAEALGGSLTVSSKVGRGSKFVCKIEAGPVANAEPPPEEPDVAELQNRGPARPTNSSPAQNARTEADAPPLEEDLLAGNILVVDDGDANRRLVSLILRKSGADVVEATNGQEALELCFPNGRLPDKEFDLIVMDMQMPILDGYAATTELRRQNYRNPIIAITAHAMKGDREKCEAAGCSDYLTKPITPRDLVDTIAAALKTSEHSSSS